MITADKLRAIPTDSLHALNRMLVEEIRWRHSQVKQVAARRFSVGDRPGSSIPRPAT